MLDIETGPSFEKPPKKFLLIDDLPQIVEALGKYLSEKGDFKSVECHSTEEALSAIRSEAPDVLFLDNSLSRGGSEGLEIAKIIKEEFPDMEIWSTTGDEGFVSKYAQMGIRHIQKSDLEGISKIMSGE